MKAEAESISAIANVLMVVATVGGFWSVYKQLQSASIDHLYSRMQEIHKIFLGDPCLRRHLFPDTSDLTASCCKGHQAGECSEKQRITCEMMADFFQQVSMELDYLPDKASSGWQVYMHDTIERSAALKAFAMQNSDWYDGDVFKQLQKSSQVKPTPRAYLGRRIATVCRKPSIWILRVGMNATERCPVCLHKR